MVYAFNFLPSLMHLLGVKHRTFGRLFIYKSFSTNGRAFKFIQHKDTPFGYDDTKFQTSTVNHKGVMGSEVHPGNGHVSKNSMNTKFQPTQFVYQFLIQSLNSNLMKV